MKALSLGYSPCPNDTFIFYALVHGKVTVPCPGKGSRPGKGSPPGEVPQPGKGSRPAEDPRPGVLTFHERLEDVETLNRMAFQEQMDITKISYHAFGHLRDRYALLRSGGALGKGCGPLLVGRQGETSGDLARQRIAVPGEFTTACLLLRLYEPKVQELIILPFDQILQAVRDGAVDAGLIIHESRFTYQNFGLQKILDLGDWWEQYSGYPIPLGGIIIKRSLGKETASLVEEGIRQSIIYAKTHQEEAKGYIHSHAQEMEDSVLRSHIGLYVNEYSLDIGPDGERAIRFLMTEAESRGIIPESSCDLFA